MVDSQEGDPNRDDRAAVDPAEPRGSEQRGGDERDNHDHHGEERGREHVDHDRQDDHHDHHDHHAHDVETLGVAVMTISSSRTVDDDPSGDAICDAVREAGHEVTTRELMADDHDRIQRTVNNVVNRNDVDVVVTTGGTGVTPDDVTIEAVRPLFRKELPGFGELFRRRSEDDIGTRVIGTRATAGIVRESPVFCLPGSENAVALGVELVLPEAGHLAGLAKRDEDEE